jgi:multidrug resistance efflux pump
MTLRKAEEILAEAFEAKGCSAYARSVRQDARTDSSFPLNIATAAIEQAQREALEEAAKHLERYAVVRTSGFVLAAEIRSLIPKGEG